MFFCFFLVCLAETEKVYKLSSEENLQPFKDKMTTFLSQGMYVFQYVYLLRSSVK